MWLGRDGCRTRATLAVLCVWQLEVGTALDRASLLTTERGVGVFRAFVLPQEDHPGAFHQVCPV